MVKTTSRTSLIIVINRSQKLTLFNSLPRAGSHPNKVLFIRYADRSAARPSRSWLARAIALITGDDHLVHVGRWLDTMGKITLIACSSPVCDRITAVKLR